MQDEKVSSVVQWPSDRYFPIFPMPTHLKIYDIRDLSADEQLSITTLVGLINRTHPQVYLLIGNDDPFWLKEAFASLPQEVVDIDKEKILEQLLTSYPESVQGLIIYDPSCIDSINVATSMAGQKDGIVVSPALAQRLQAVRPLPILADLRKYRWQSRLQAYQWAMQHVLPTADTHLVAGLDPNKSHALRTFLVATRAFVYWLDTRNGFPDFRAGWLSERSLTRTILSNIPPGGLHLGWFIDEPGGVALVSDAALAVVATDYFNNLEVWTAMASSLPLQTTMGEDIQVGSSTEQVYISFTMSEGDNLQYNQHRLAQLWADPARGSVPIGWTLSPMLSEAAPQMAAYYLRTATPNDELIAGPSGAGYMYPMRWPARHLPHFLQRTGQLMKTMGLTTLEVLETGFFQRGCLNPTHWEGGISMAFTDATLQQRYVDALVPYGLKGIVSGNGQRGLSYTKVQGIPVYQNLGLAMSVNGTVNLIRKTAAANPQRSLYLNVYVLAWNMTPSDLKEVMQQLGTGYEAVTPAKLLSLLASQSSQ